MTESNVERSAAANGDAAKAKPTRDDVILSLVKRSKALEVSLEQESNLRALGLSKAGDDADLLRARVDQLETSLFLLFTCYIDLIGPARGSDDPAIVEEAQYNTNLSLTQQAALAPKLYERAYGFDAQTGELLPGRTAGVPIALDADEG